MGQKPTGHDDRWGAAGSFGKWLHLKLTQAGMKPDTTFVYFHKEKRKKYVMDAETIVSVLLDAGQLPEHQQAIYDLLQANERKGRPLRDVIEQMGKKLVATGFFERDPKTRMQNFSVP